MIKLLLSTAMVAVLLTGCKKETVKEPAKTKTQMLTASNWIPTAATIDPAIDAGGTKVTDLFAQMEPCDKDDFFKYETNNLGTNNEGATKCDPANPQIESFTWAFNASETAITEDGEVCTIDQLDETTLKYYQIYDGEDVGGTPGIKYKITVTHRH